MTCGTTRVGRTRVGRTRDDSTRRASCLARALLGALLAAASPMGVVSEALARPAPASFADLAARLLPAVVNISSTETVKAGAGPSEDEGGDDGGDGDAGPSSPFPPGSPFEKFFHDFLDHQHGPGGEDAPRRMQSLGSGFIIDPSGLVVTNNHVIAGADAVTVTLQDNTVLVATVVAHDDRTDLALLRVKSPKPLPSVGWGDSNATRVGDWVLAIGNPFGLGGTVTAGIVSARGRDIQEGPYDDFIQTDAPINRGNSGGPLFDMDGNVVGINTAIYSPSGGSIGIGFSIPAAEAKLVIEQLRDYGRARRGWIGVRVQAVTPDIATGLGLKNPDGALVAGVDQKGPAAAAKLHTGDVILTFNGAPVEAMRTLPRVVAETAIGAKVDMTVWRNGKNQTLPITVAELPDDAKPAAAPAVTNRKPAAPAGTVIEAFNMTVAAVDDTLRHRFSLGSEQHGVVVTAAPANGVASDHGIKPGDLVLEVQQTNLSTPSQLLDAVLSAQHAARGSLLLLVQDSDGSRWVPMPLKPARTRP